MKGRMVVNGVEQGGQKGREKEKEGQERGNWYPRFLYEGCAAQPLWAGSASNLAKYTDNNNLLSAAATITSAL